MPPIQSRGFLRLSQLQSNPEPWIPRRAACAAQFSAVTASCPERPGTALALSVLGFLAANLTNYAPFELATPPRPTGEPADDGAAVRKRD